MTELTGRHIDAGRVGHYGSLLTVWSRVTFDPDLKVVDDSKTSALMLTLSAYAKHRGVTLNAVKQAISDGRLDKSVSVGESGRKLVTPELADIEWDANTNAGTGFRAHMGRHALLRTSVRRPARFNVTPIATNLTYSEARAERERFMAQLARLEYEKKSGTLVDAQHVKREAFRAARVVRDALLNIPDRMAGELAAETNHLIIHRRLVGEIEKALEGLAGES